MSLEERFWQKVQKTYSCWLWIGSRSPKGYGQIWNKDGTSFAHRVSWIIHNGYINSEQLVCHTCDNPPCVNPDHLFLGSHQDNVTDRDSKGRQWHKGQITCKAGHQDWKFDRDGHRRCQTCEREYYQSHKENWILSDDQKRIKNERRKQRYAMFIQKGGKRKDWRG